MLTQGLDSLYEIYHFEAVNSRLTITYSILILNYSILDNFFFVCKKCLNQKSIHICYKNLCQRLEFKQ